MLLEKFQIFEIALTLKNLSIYTPPLNVHFLFTRSPIEHFIIKVNVDWSWYKIFEYGPKYNIGMHGGGKIDILLRW